jgi:ferrous iron transport protein B
MVVTLNIMDELTSNGGSVDVNTLEMMLGVPVVPISAAKNQGVDELIKHAVHIAHYQEKPVRQDFCASDEKGGAVHRCLHAVRHLIEDKAVAADLPLHFAASKVVEGDKLVLEKLKLEDSEKQMLEHIIRQMEKECGLDRNAAIADMRFSFIRKVCGRTVVKPKESREHIRSTRIDRILTGKYTAIPTFVLIMVAIFWLTFDIIGGNLQKLLEIGIDNLTQITKTALEHFHVNPIFTGLITDGVFAGIGSVLSFLPIIVVLFLFLSILEDSGYLARVASLWISFFEESDSRDEALFLC